MKQEFKLIKTFSSRYIVKFYGAFENRKEFILLFEFAKYGDLFSILKKKRRFTEKEAAICISDVLKGLEYLNSLKVVHRDLKLKNVLLVNKKESPRFKLCDFGLSDHIDTIDQSPTTGTIGYIAPEIFSY